MERPLSWRPVRIHAEGEDAFDAQMLLCCIETCLLDGRGASYSFERTQGSHEPSVSLRLVLDGGRSHDTLLVPLYQGWPFTVAVTKDIMSAYGDGTSGRDAVTVKDVITAVNRIGDLCVDPLPLWDQEQHDAALDERSEAAMYVCALLSASEHPDLDAYRSRDGHFDVDRSDGYDGTVTTLVLDPDMAGDDRTIQGLVEDAMMARILSKDPFDVGLGSRGRDSRTWSIGMVGPRDGIVVSSKEVDPMTILRRLGEIL
jgi:hypothetical protein